MKTKTLPGGVVVAIQGQLPYQQAQWVKGRYYERSMLDYIRKHYSGGTFIDGGACIGNHALYFAKFCAQQVIAIEPQERNMAHLVTNIKLSKLGSKIITVKAALGEKASRGKMINVGTHHGGWELVGGNEVEITTLNEVGKLAKYPIGLIKLDIEGSELRALRGGVALLNEHSPGIIFEAKTKPELVETAAFLVSIGYTRAPFSVKKYNYLFTRV